MILIEDRKTDEWKIRIYFYKKQFGSEDRMGRVENAVTIAND